VQYRYEWKGDGPSETPKMSALKLSDKEKNISLLSPLSSPAQKK
jgi:hypothetical protein